jgi:hypothetical protein
MSMAITKEQYKDMKEYWDYQRKVQYNKELVYNMANQFENRVYNEFGQVNIQEVKSTLWDRVKSEDYEEPRKGWIPEDPNLRFEEEGSAFMPEWDYESPKKGRRVVLKAKKVDDDNNI